MMGAIEPLACVRLKRPPRGLPSTVREPGAEGLSVAFELDLTRCAVQNRAKQMGGSQHRFREFDVLKRRFTFDHHQ